MEVTELMIGDIVRSTFYKSPVRITDLSVAAGDYGFVMTKNDDCYKSVESLIPIPLTEEILKTNGFYHPKFDDGSDVKHVLVYGKNGILYLTKNRNYFFISSTDASIHIHYVHELQHVLRMCGLKELADNFKIQ